MSPPAPPDRWAAGGAREPAEAAAARVLERAGAPEDPEPGARERSWRTLAASLDRPRRARPGLALGGAAVAAAVLVGLLWPRASPGPRARLTLRAGAVQVAPPAGGRWSPAEAGGWLEPGGRLRAAADGASVAGLALARSTVLASAGAGLALDSLGPEVVLGLTGGELTAEVEPRQAGEAYAVQTTRYRVTVKGTLFSVRERSPEDVEVVVRRGLVEVSGDGGRWQVPAGRRWRSVEPGVLVEGDLATGELRRLVEAGGGAGSVPEEGPPPAGPAAVGPAPAGEASRLGALPASEAPQGPEREVLRLPSPGPLPSVRLPAAPGSSPEVARRRVGADAPAIGGADLPAPRPPAPPRLDAPGPGPVPRRDVAALGPARPTLPMPDPGPDLAAVRPAEPAPPRPLRRDLVAQAVPATAGPALDGASSDPYQRAQALAREGRHQEAAAALEAVAEARGPHADLARYELGRLRQLRLGQPQRALEAYARYQQDYPRGSLIQEVELSTLELQLQASDLAAALGTLERFLQRHPGSERVDELRVLRGDVLRERGDCGAAVTEFEKVQGGPQADDATYFAGWCQQALGRTAEAVSTLRAYLQRFPRGRHRAEARAALGEGDEKE